MDESKMFMAVFLMVFSVCGLYAIIAYGELADPIYEVLIAVSKVFFIILTPLSLLIGFDALVSVGGGLR